jgi:hypothetical protein
MNRTLLRHAKKVFPLSLAQYSSERQQGISASRRKARLMAMLYRGEYAAIADVGPSQHSVSCATTRGRHRRYCIVRLSAKRFRQAPCHCPRRSGGLAQAVP